MWYRRAAIAAIAGAVVAVGVVVAVSAWFGVLGVYGVPATANVASGSRALTQPTEPPPTGEPTEPSPTQPPTGEPSPPPPTQTPTASPGQPQPALTADPSSVPAGNDVTARATGLPISCYRLGYALDLDGEPVDFQILRAEVVQTPEFVYLVEADLRFTVAPQHALGVFDLELYCLPGTGQPIATTQLTIIAAGGQPPASPSPGGGDRTGPEDPGGLAGVAATVFGCAGLVVLLLVAVWVVTFIARSRSKRPTLPQQLRLAGHRQVVTPPTFHPLDQRPALTLSYRPHFDPGVQQLTEAST